MVKMYYNRVLRVACFYLKNRSEAEDITQDVFLKAFHKIDFSKTDNSKFPILYTITKNLSLNRIKSKKWNDFSLIEWDVISTVLDPEAQYIKKEEEKRINDSLNQLKKTESEILILKHYQECSYKEISEILNIPIGTVMSRLYSARKNLGKKLKGD